MCLRVSSIEIVATAKLNSRVLSCSHASQTSRREGEMTGGISGWLSIELSLAETYRRYSARVLSILARISAALYVELRANDNSTEDRSYARTLSSP